MKSAHLRSLYVLALSTSASPALAQSQSTATNQTPPSDATTPQPPASATASPGAPVSPGDGRIQDIVVTAQRRSERLQNVPIAVTAQTAAALETAGVQNTVDLGRVTPGLTTVQTAGFAEPHIRGIGNTASAAGIENAVATYVDGVYLASAPASILSLNNVDRIEVLKGPQGTLFGRNATGGLIQVVTKDPRQETSGAVNLSYGNYKDVTGDLYATTGLTDSLAADLAVRYEHQGDGYGRNFATGNDTYKLYHDFAVRTKFLLDAGPNTKIRAAFDYEDNKNSLFTQSITANGYAGLFNSGPLNGVTPLPSVYDVTQNVDPISTLKGGGASLQINQDVGGVSIQSITAYRRSSFNVVFDADFTAVNYDRLSITQEDNQFSQELQVSGRNPGRFKWVGGVYFFHADGRNAPFLLTFYPSAISPVPNTTDVINISDAQKTTAIAGYAQGTYEVLTGTNLTFGVRYSYERRSLSGTETFSINGATASTESVPTAGIAPHTSYSKPTFRAAVDHRFGANVLGYFSFNTGFKSGGYNADYASNPPFKAEAIKAYEVGLKSELFDRHLRFNIAGFHYNYSNIQVARYENGQQLIYNGSAARLDGFDIDSEVVLGYGLALTGGFSFLHTKLTSFPDAPYVAAVGRCTPPFGGFCTASATGNKLPFSPETTLNVGLTYKTDTSFGLLTFAGDYFRSASFFGVPDNVLRQGAYDLGNASVTWTAHGSGFSLKGFIKNVGSTKYVTALVENNQGPTRSYGAPRTYGVTAGYKF